MAKGSGNTRSSKPSANPQLKGAGNTEKQTEHPGNPDYYYWEREAKAYMMTKGGMTDKEAEDTLAAIKSWAGSGYEGVRSWQFGRTNKEPDFINEYYKDRADILEKFIEKMPKWAGGTTYRGMDAQQKRQFFEALDIGDQWDAKSLNSWSSDYAIGMSFANYGGKSSVLLRCQSPQNGTSIKNMGGLRRESEVLTSGKCRYRVVGKSYDDKGTLIVDLEPISNGKVRKE